MSHQDAQNWLPSPRVGEGLGVGVVRQQTVMYPRTLSSALLKCTDALRLKPETSRLKPFSGGAQGFWLFGEAEACEQR